MHWRKSKNIMEGNKEVGGRIYTESEGLTSISYGEIGDKAVSMNENQAVAKADEWIGTAFIGFDISLLDNIKPIVGDMRKTQWGMNLRNPLSDTELNTQTSITVLEYNMRRQCTA